MLRATHEVITGVTNHNLTWCDSDDSDVCYDNVNDSDDSDHDSNDNDSDVPFSYLYHYSAP